MLHMGGERPQRQTSGKAEAEDARKRGIAALGPGSPSAKELDSLAASLGLARTE